MSDYIKREDAIRELNAEGYTKNMRIHKRILDVPAADVRENKWINVTDELPAFDQKVLAFVKNKDPKCRFNPDGVYVAELKDKIPVPDPKGEKNVWGIPGYDSEWTVWAWSYFSEPCVTHWMPLPKPPVDNV